MRALCVKGFLPLKFFTVLNFQQIPKHECILPLNEDVQKINSFPLKNDFPVYSYLVFFVALTLTDKAKSSGKKLRMCMCF
jgi:hypothetical protein